MIRPPLPVPESARLMTVAEVAHHLQASIRTVRRFGR